MLKFGVRWKTTSWAACLAMIGIDWMAEEPVPMYPDPLTGEVDPFVRPVPGVIPRALEGLEALDLGHLRVGQAARGHDAELRRHAVAAVGLDRPPVRGLVEEGRGHSRLELNVAAQ